MEKIIKNYDELKSMCLKSNQKLYLADFFIDLKAQVDLAFVKLIKNNDETISNNYIEIINKIELFEQICYKQAKTISHDQIQFIQKRIESSNNNNKNILDDTNYDEINELIEIQLYKLEKMLFNNKTIYFINNNNNSNSIDKNFLIIINDEYIRKKILDNSNNNVIQLTGEHLKALYLLNNKIYNLNIILNVNEFNLDLCNLNELDFLENQIAFIKPNTFSGLNQLTRLDLERNLLRSIDSKTFNGLNSTKIRKIFLDGNKIKQIHFKTFTRLTKLTEINISFNRLANIDSKLLNGLNDLQILNLNNNRIEQLSSDIFDGLTSLKEIHFSNNQLSDLAPNTFKGLVNLTFLDLSYSKFAFFV